MSVDSLINYEAVKVSLRRGLSSPAGSETEVPLTSASTLTTKRSKSPSTIAR